LAAEEIERTLDCYAPTDERPRACWRNGEPPVPPDDRHEKHLLPIYDRPMIYYPLETLAGMGIREVMVIVGGKSVGDVVELLADGSHFGLDLTYRYQRGALGIAHAIGLAQDFVGDDSWPSRPSTSSGLVTNEDDGADELGFAWEDRAVGAPSPPVDTLDGRAILSKPDRFNPTRAEGVTGH